VQAVCDRIVVINEGRVVANDTEENLSHKLTGDNKFICRIDGGKDTVMRLLQKIDGVDKVYCDAEHKNHICDYRIEAKEGKEIRYELFKVMAENGYTILELKSAEMNLEDIFLKLTMGEQIPALDDNDEEADN
jgi:ABC-2 type transport system ATP-binding protein